jgi:hypothetical protein
MKKKAGRKAEFGERKVIISLTVTPTLRRFLASQNSASSHVESTMRNTLAFIHWTQNENNSEPPAV